eukprot:RCo015167
MVSIVSAVSSIWAPVEGELQKLSLGWGEIDTLLQRKAAEAPQKVTSPSLAPFQRCVGELPGIIGSGGARGRVKAAIKERDTDLSLLGKALGEEPSCALRAAPSPAAGTAALPLPIPLLPVPGGDRSVPTTGGRPVPGRLSFTATAPQINAPSPTAPTAPSPTTPSSAASTTESPDTAAALANATLLFEKLAALGAATTPGGMPGVPIPVLLAPKIYCLVEFKRGRTLQYETRSYVAPGEYVMVGGDRGEDLGMVTFTWLAPAPAGAAGGAADSADAPSPASPASPVQYDNYGNPVPTDQAIVGRVLRRATAKEIQHLHSVQAELERRCVEVCQQKVNEYGLVMVVVDAEYQFDRKKLTFYYDAPDRQDFRDLVRDLYKIYRARIWMSKVTTR